MIYKIENKTNFGNLSNKNKFNLKLTLNLIFKTHYIYINCKYLFFLMSRDVKYYI